MDWIINDIKIIESLQNEWYVYQNEMFLNLSQRNFDNSF
jgi:hypothetical protein